MNRRSFNGLWLLMVAFALLMSAGCRAEVEPAPAASPQATDAPVEASITATPTSLAPTAEAAKEEPVEQPAAEDESEDETLPNESAQANADVEFVRATQAADGTWRFDVTVRHPDTGWEDYADGWDVVTSDGQVLKADESDPFTRLLLHPHENEQPFTRSQSGIVLPDGVTVVLVRAHDLVDGFGGRQIEVDLTLDQGPGFEVIR